MQRGLVKVAANYDVNVVGRRIDAYLRKKKSPLAGYGRAFAIAAKKYNLPDPYLLPAIAGAESSFGTYGPTARIYNAWGWGPHIPFTSWKQGINKVAQGLSEGYISQGLTTIPQIRDKYIPQEADPEGWARWGPSVRQFRDEIRGTKVQLPRRQMRVRTPTRQPESPSMEARTQALAERQLDAALITSLHNRTRAMFGLPESEIDIGSMLLPRPDANPEPDEPGTPGIPKIVRGPTGKQRPAGPSSGVPKNWSRWVSVPKPTGNTSKPTKVYVLKWISGLARSFGQPLGLFDNTHHSKYTTSGNVSDHWDGSAADIPMAGERLTKLGQLALIRAGANPRWAKQQKGGLFNINGFQIIFNTNQGGNHYDHLHVGYRRGR